MKVNNKNYTRINYSKNLIRAEEKIRGIPQGDGIELQDIKPPFTIPPPP